MVPSMAKVPDQMEEFRKAIGGVVPRQCKQESAYLLLITSSWPVSVGRHTDAGDVAGFPFAGL